MIERDFTHHDFADDDFSDFTDNMVSDFMKMRDIIDIYNDYHYKKIIFDFSKYN